MINKFLKLILVFYLLFSSYVFGSFNFGKDLSNLPILHEGRVKPLVSLSDSILSSLCGEKRIDGLTSLEWLLELFFLKENAYKRNIFFINDLNLLLNVDIKAKSINMYSLNDVAEPLLKNIHLIKAIENIDYSLRTASQKELLRLYEKFLFVLRLDLLTQPLFLNENVSNNINLRDDLLRFLLDTTDIYLFPGKFDSWFNLDINQSFRLNFILMSEIAAACKNYDYVSYKRVALKLVDYSYSFLNDAQNKRVKVEIYYNFLSPIFTSLCFYFFTFLFCVLGFVRTFSSYALNISILTFFCGLFVHFFAILARIFIAGRAPVTTLFESILFVNFILALFTIVICLLNKNYRYLFLFCGIIFVFLLQYIVYVYEFDGDTIKVLLPVLNTNFWLTVHVVVISIGYAFCLISSIVAHIFLLDYAFNFKNKCFNKNFHILRTLCIVALFFSALGTILGGIWADQSWGRFWGWDPKENGALLIVLWLIFTLHFRLTNLFSLFLFFVFIMLNGVVVFLAWFGVNLLNAGLHSYGFVQNIGKNLLFYCSFEFIFIIFVVLIYFFYRHDYRERV